MNTKEVFSFPITLEKLREIERTYGIEFPKDITDKSSQEQLVDSFAWLIIKKVMSNLNYHPELDVTQVSVETNLVDLGLDALDRLELQAKIEELLDMTVFEPCDDPLEDTQYLVVGTIQKRIKDVLLTP